MVTIIKPYMFCLPELAAVGGQRNKKLSSAAASVKLPSGKTLPVELHSNKCRCVKFDGEVTAVEQNKAKPSDWTAKAKKGAKITWFLTGPKYAI